MPTVSLTGKTMHTIDTAQISWSGDSNRAADFAGKFKTHYTLVE